MNTERLYELLTQLTQEAKRIRLVDLMDELIQHISNQVNEPSNAAHQTSFSSTQLKLKVAVASSWFVRLTPLESDVLEKMDLGLLVGWRLPNRISELVRNNGMLPAVVRDQLGDMAKRVKRGLEDASNTLASFAALGFDEGELDVGVGELAMRIPREVISQRFSSFIEDAQFLHDLVSVAIEIVEGKPDDPTLRSLASSDYAIFLQVAPAVVGFTVLAIERVMAGYKTVLEIRVLQNQLKERDGPKEAFDALEAHLEKRMKEVARRGIEAALKEMKPKVSKERLNELKNLAAVRFTQLIERLEKGYDLDGRVGHADVAPDDDAEKAEHDKLVQTDAQVRRGIRAVRKQIKEAKGLKVLEYKPDDEPGATDDDGEAEEGRE